jgi:uncharacterized protein
MQARIANILLSFLALLLLATLPAACSRPAPPNISLYRAIHAEDLDQIKRHILYGADLNQMDRDGQMPLHVAAEQGSQVLCALLIKHGARLDAHNRQDRTPLEVAVLAGKISVARLLLRYGAALDIQHLLGEVIRSGTDFRDVYDFLLRHGADLNAPDATGNTPLIIAVLTGNRLTVKRLVDRGADINRPGADGLTPLALARRRGDGDIVRLLRQYGAAGGS